VDTKAVVNLANVKGSLLKLKLRKFLIVTPNKHQMTNEKLHNNVLEKSEDEFKIKIMRKIEIMEALESLMIKRFFTRKHHEPDYDSRVPLDSATEIKVFSLQAISKYLVL
ncbi:hypothetical protein F8M41_017886, partial [Gigaspora margarita]